MKRWKRPVSSTCVRISFEISAESFGLALLPLSTTTSTRQNRADKTDQAAAVDHTLHGLPVQKERRLERKASRRASSGVRLSLTTQKA